MTTKADPNAILPLVEDLCRFRTGVVAPENAAMFERIRAEIPIRLRPYRSGEEHNGWIVPPEWRVKRAEIRRDGRLLFDGAQQALGVAAASDSFRGTLTLEELLPHIVSDPARPSAFVYHCRWLYRPWETDWAFSVPHEISSRWEPGRYEVTIETEKSPGEMLVADYHLPGERPETIVFNAHTCHPHMANDGMSGVATIVRLFQWLASVPRRYSYRCVFGPEHLGTIFYLRERSPEEIAQLVAAVFVEMTGTAEPIKAASSFLGGQTIDRAIRHAIRHHARAHEFVGWRRGAGNDETVWEAPGHEIPCVELTRCRSLFDPYPEYHTDLDTPRSLIPEQVTEVYETLVRAVEIIEKDAVMTRTFDGLLCLSHPKYDLYFNRADPSIPDEKTDERWGALMDSILRYFDGSTTILDVAEKHDLPFNALVEYIRRFQEKGLIDIRPALIQRPNPLKTIPRP